MRVRCKSETGQRGYTLAGCNQKGGYGDSTATATKKYEV